MSKENALDAAARMTSKGQITIPKAVRDALGLKERDSVLFRVEGQRAVIARIPDFLELAGSVPVPPELKGLPLQELLRLEDEAVEKSAVERWARKERRSR